MGRSPADPLRLRAGDREVLERIAGATDPRAGGPGAAAARRAEILLAAADGISNSEIARRLGSSRQSVSRWRSRYAAEGVDCLRDRPRPGRPRALVPSEIIVRTLRAPTRAEAPDGRWSTRTLAAALGISSATVARAWSRYGIRPAQGGSLALDTRPAVRVRSGRIVGLHVAPPLGLVAFRGSSDGTDGDAPAELAGPRAPGPGSLAEVAAFSTALAAAPTRSTRERDPRSVVGSAGARSDVPDASDAESAADEFIARARAAGAQVIATGRHRGADGSENVARVDTFSSWLQVAEALALATVASHGASALREVRARTRRSTSLDGTVHWCPDGGEDRPHTAAEEPAEESLPAETRPRVTMRDVAAVAEVSVKTVSNSLTGAKRVAPMTQKRIDGAVRDLGYQVNTAARQLRTGRHGAVVLAVPELRLSYYAELAERIIDEAEQRQLSVLVQTTRGELERERRVVDSARRRADGLIIAAHALTPEVLSRITTTGPFVLLGEAVQGIGVDQITISNAEAATTAMDHLLASGRRRVALLGVSPRPVAEARVRGCRVAADRHDVDLDPDLMLPTSAWRRDVGEQEIGRILDRGVPFDAVVGFNDELALGAQRALLSRGVRIPKDVAVLGFDNSDEAEYSRPGLTSIAPAFDVIARTAVDLVARSDTAAAGRRTPTQTIVPHRLMVRGSSG